ncbi:MAG: hypothetical protein DMF78_08835 [Acidobacteria bacterium]|nr:MAG: hypothetical protein DMF78_08835 [Acidobacteriota bacterium]
MALSRRAALVAGIVTLVVTLPNVVAGLRAAFMFARDGQWLYAGIGLLAGLASLGLLAVGVRLCAKRVTATRPAQAAAAASIVAHAAGVSVGLMGLVAALVGIVYPAVLLVLLRRTPPTGAPASATEADRERRGEEREKQDSRLRAATA